MNNKKKSNERIVTTAQAESILSQIIKELRKNKEQILAQRKKDGISFVIGNECLNISIQSL